MFLEERTFLIDSKPVGAGNPPFIIGEVAQAHDGSLGMAHAFIDAIAKAGADAVKFQTHIAAAESSALEPFRVRFSQQDATRYAYWKRMEFTPEQWAGLAQHARDCHLIFLSSPFSNEAVDLLENIGMPAWKIASGEVSNPLLLRRIVRTGRPVLLSTGISPIAEIDRAVAIIQEHGLPLAVMQCASRYPTRPEDVGLNLLRAFRERYGTPVGLSDHSGQIYPGLAAVTLGASLVEAHVTLSRDSFGPDVPVSLTPAELRQLVEGARFIYESLQHPVDKDLKSQEFTAIRETFSKSLTSARDLPAGSVLGWEDLAARKPGTGIPAADIDKVLGKKLKASRPRDAFLAWEDFEEEVSDR